MVTRIGNNQLADKVLFNLRAQQSRQDQLFEQISSNKRILRPSDDPVGTSNVMGIQHDLSKNVEYERVINQGNVWTNVTTTAIESAISTWKRVNEIGISAADGTKTAADRQSMAEELEQLLQHLVQVGNTSNQGKYIFSGSKTDQAAFRTEIDANTGRITGVFYEGDSSVKQVKSKDQGSVPLNTLGSNAGDPDKPGLFVDSNEGLNAFNTIIQLRDKLLENDIIGISGSTGVLNDVEKVARSMTAAQVRIGGTQQVFELDQARIIDDTANLETFRDEIEKADVTKLILELNNLQNVYDAALATAGRLFSRSLINFI